MNCKKAASDLGRRLFEHLGEVPLVQNFRFADDANWCAHGTLG